MSVLCENLCFSFGTVPVLRSISFSAQNGRMVAILGPNGVGKTTLFRCILGLSGKYTGTIRIDEENADLLSPKERADRVAYISQVHTLSFGYSVMDMVLMGTAHSVGVLSQPGKKQTDAAMSALEKLGIGDLHERLFIHLSGGEQQLVLIARALAQNAGTLLMDEPTSSLDYGNQNRVLETVRKLSEDGYCVLLSTHNPQHAYWYADDALALYQGKVAAFGKPEDVLTAELIGRLYQMNVHLLRTESGLLVEPERMPDRRGKHV